MTFSLLIRPCFLAFYTTNVIIKSQLSRRECFYLLVFLIFFFIYYIKASPPADSEAIGENFIA